MITTVLLALIVAELGFIGWFSARPKPLGSTAVESRPEAPKPLVSVPTDNDLRIEALIQRVDPAWKIGDPRDHIDLLPGPDGHIIEARLK